jgi:hypothetical protein
MPLWRQNINVLSTDHEMIPASNTIGTHAQDFVAKEALLLPVLKIFHRTLAQSTFLEMLDVFSLRGIVEDSVAPTNSSPVSPPPRPGTPRQVFRYRWNIRCLVACKFVHVHSTKAHREARYVAPRILNLRNEAKWSDSLPSRLIPRKNLWHPLN